MKILTPFVGAVLVLIGAALAFAGAKFIFYAFAALIFMLISGLCFMIFYNVMPPEKTSLGVLIGGLLVSVILGALFAYYLGYKFAKEWSVALVGAWAGIVLGLVGSKVAGVTNGTVTLGMALVCGLIGGYLGRKWRRGLKSFGTAFVGAFLMIRGVACYVGGYPSEYQLPSDVNSKES